MTTPSVCLVEPFRYAATPQPVGDQGASSNQINEQQIEDYLNRLRVAVCADIQAIIDGGSGARTFLQLTDTPDTYLGAGGQAVVVNAGETGLVFADFPTPDVASFLERVIFYAQQISNSAAGANTSFLGYGGLLGVNGTFAVVTPASGSPLTTMPRRTITSTAGAGSTSSLKSGAGIVLRGTVSGEGGFRFVTYVGTTTALAQQRAFFGLAATAGVIGNVNPSTLLNIFGIAYDSAQTTLRVMHNDGALAASSIDLGANFPVDATTAYKIELSCQPASSSMSYRVTNLASGNVAFGSINADLPVATTLLLAHIWANNGTTASAVVLNFTSILVEMVQ